MYVEYIPIEACFQISSIPDLVYMIWYLFSISVELGSSFYRFLQISLVLQPSPSFCREVYMKAIMEWDHAHLSKGHLPSSNINFIPRMQILTSNHVYLLYIGFVHLVQPLNRIWTSCVFISNQLSIPEVNSNISHYIGTCSTHLSGHMIHMKIRLST